MVETTLEHNHTFFLKQFIKLGWSEDQAEQVWLGFTQKESPQLDNALGTSYINVIARSSEMHTRYGVTGFTGAALTTEAVVESIAQLADISKSGKKLVCPTCTTHDTCKILGFDDFVALNPKLVSEILAVNRSEIDKSIEGVIKFAESAQTDVDKTKHLRRFADKLISVGFYISQRENTELFLPYAVAPFGFDWGADTDIDQPKSVQMTDTEVLDVGMEFDTLCDAYHIPSDEAISIWSAFISMGGEPVDIERMITKMGYTKDAPKATANSGQTTGQVVPSP